MYNEPDSGYGSFYQGRGYGLHYQGGGHAHKQNNYQAKSSCLGKGYGKSYNGGSHAFKRIGTRLKGPHDKTVKSLIDNESSNEVPSKNTLDAERTNEPNVNNKDKCNQVECLKRFEEMKNKISRLETEINHYKNREEEFLKREEVSIKANSELLKRDKEQCEELKSLRAFANILSTLKNRKKESNKKN